MICGVSYAGCLVPLRFTYKRYLQCWRPPGLKNRGEVGKTLSLSADLRNLPLKLSFSHAKSKETPKSKPSLSLRQSLHISHFS